MSLFPQPIEVPDEVEDLEDVPVEYPTSVMFDFEAGDFVTVGGRVVETDGYQAWAQWCVKNVLTERQAFLVYGDDFGVDLELEEPGTRAEVEERIAAEIRDALEADERTGRVHSFDFEWAGDSLRLSFVIDPTVGTPERISVSFSGLT